MKNKVAVITGASDGIGKEIAIALSKAGARVALVSRNREKLTKTVQQIGKTKSKFYQCDIRKTCDIGKAVKAITADFGKIDILVNNAGIIHKPMTLEDMDEETVDSVLDTNLKGMIHVTRLFMPHFKKNSDGAIINISSVAGTRAKKGESVYAASKWGVRGFTKVLKEDLGETNIRVACVCQGGTATELFKKAGDNRDTTRFTRPGDLAQVILFMLTRPKRCWIHEIHVEK